MPAPSIAAARAYAVQHHGAQMYGPHPYVFHLDAVVQTLAPFGPEAQTIGYLHDVVEDTPATLEDVRAHFGEHVAACVALLTDAPGATRKQRKAITYARLATVSGPLQTALVVKVADRLSNVRACVADANLARWSMYHGEHAVFRASAYRSGLCDALWAELDRLLDPANRPADVVATA